MGKKHEIKIKDKIFVFELPDGLDIDEAVNDWVELKAEKYKKDVWTTIPCLPQYKFKNLKIIEDDFDDDKVELNVTFQYDEFKDIEL